MKEKSFKEIIAEIGYVLICFFLVCLLVIAGDVLVRTFQMETSSVARIRLHTYLTVGFASFFVLFLIPRVRRNTHWMMSFTHEFTHLLFALLFFREIYRFKVDSKDSHVSFSGGWYGYIPITLSPYCVPLFTIALLPWRFTTATSSPFFLAVIDILIGFTFAFHVCCWIKQIRIHQTDIIGPGIVRSLLVIAFFIIMNLCVVILTPSSGVVNAISRVFWEFPSAFVNSLI